MLAAIRRTQEKFTCANCGKHEWVTVEHSGFAYKPLGWKGWIHPGLDYVQHTCPNEECQKKMEASVKEAWFS